jgi:hypothetical protein
VSPVDPNAIVASIASVLVASFVFGGVIVQSRRPSKTKTSGVDTPEGLPTMATFDKAPFEVIQNLLLRMAHYEAAAETSKTALEAHKGEIEEIKAHQATFSSAVKRYLMKLAAAWKGPEPMPWPDEDDIEILHKTLPYHKVGSSKKEG